MTSPAKSGRAKAELRPRSIADAAHELRTPLGVVIGMARLLLDTGLDAEQADYAATIRSGAESAAAVVADLVDRASIEAGGLRIEEAPFSPRQIVRECVELVVPQAAERRLDVSHRVESSVPPTLVGDGARLRRIVFQALAQVVNESGDGRMSVTASARRRSARTIEFRVCVRFPARGRIDGLPPARGAHGEESGRSAREELVRRMNASVRVGRAKGGVARLDVAFVVRRAAAGGRSRGAGSGAAGSGGRAYRALVADDDALSRKAAVRTLARAGWSVDSAADGAAALDAAVRGGYDVVLLDLHLAGSDGRDVAREIRRRARPQAPRIVAMTAACGAEDREACRSAGIVACISKPVDADRVRDALRGVEESPKNAAAPPTKIDAAVLRRYRSMRAAGAAPLVLAEMIDLYVGEIPGQLDRLRVHVSTSDAAALRERAHHVAGTSASIGAVGVAALAVALERLADEGNLDRAVGVLAQIEDAWPAVKAALLRERAR